MELGTIRSGAGGWFSHTGADGTCVLVRVELGQDGYRVVELYVPPQNGKRRPMSAVLRSLPLKAIEDRFNFNGDEWFRHPASPQLPKKPGIPLETLASHFREDWSDPEPGEEHAHNWVRDAYLSTLKGLDRVPVDRDPTRESASVDFFLDPTIHVNEETFPGIESVQIVQPLAWPAHDAQRPPVIDRARLMITLPPPNKYGKVERPYPNSFFRNVADAYAAAMGLNPKKPIEVILDGQSTGTLLNKRTVQDWVRRCRSLGYLPPAPGQGCAGWVYDWENYVDPEHPSLRS